MKSHKRSTIHETFTFRNENYLTFFSIDFSKEEGEEEGVKNKTIHKLALRNFVTVYLLFLSSHFKRKKCIHSLKGEETHIF